MKSLREKYVRPHPSWPTNEEEAISEISEINDLLDRGGWTKAERNWAYSRRRKLQRYISDDRYRQITSQPLPVPTTPVDGGGSNG